MFKTKPLKEKLCIIIHKIHKGKQYKLQFHNYHTTHILYSEACLNRTLNKLKPCISRTLNKELNVGNLRIFNLYKQNTCLYQTLNKPEPCIYRTFKKALMKFNLYKPNTILNTKAGHKEV